MLDPTQQALVVPEQCGCGNRGFEDLEPYYTHQEIELPEIQMEVTHFLLHVGRCTQCGKRVKAKVPEEHRSGYGPRFSGLIGAMAGDEGNSRTTIQGFCASVLKVSISLGAIQKVIDRVSSAIEPIYEAIGTIVRGSEVNGVDETSWWEQGILKWLWVMVNHRAALFLLHARRSREAFEALIEQWQGILITDGYRVYQQWVNLRQTCLAHLIRDARWLAEQSDQGIQSFGHTAVVLLQRLCSMAHAPPDERSWNEFYTQLLDLMFDNLQRRDSAGRFARRLLRELDSLWVFLEVAGVEPTNNRSERTLRFGVLWRKRSQGTRGEKGNRWVERILSVRQTARLRRKSSFDILVDAVRSYFNGTTPDLSWLLEN
jgi:transposase